MDHSLVYHHSLIAYVFLQIKSRGGQQIGSVKGDGCSRGTAVCCLLSVICCLLSTERLVVLLEYLNSTRMQAVSVVKVSGDMRVGVR
jgi:hypothetical protein